MFSNFFFTRVALPLVEAFSSSNFWSLYKEMERFQTLSAAEKLTFQKFKLAKLIAAAGKQTDYWQERFSKCNIDTKNINPDLVLDILTKIPTTTKSDYNTGFPDRVTSQGDKIRWQYLSSAGTTDRMTVVTDFNKRDHLRAAEHLNLKLALGHPLGRPTIDIPPNACNVVCGLADEGPEPIWEYIRWRFKHGALFNRANLSDIRGRVERQILLKRKTLLPINPGPWSTISKQLDVYLDTIVTDNIEVVRGLPQFLFWLAKRIKERRLQLNNISAVLPYGGLASEAIVKEVSEAFSAPFIDIYGTGEVGAIGCSSTNQGYLNVYQNLIYLEILDEHHKPVKPGTPGRIVVTDLNNMAMPIIRYDIGDIGIAVDNENDRQNQKIKVLGRKQECYKTASGCLVTSRDLQNLFLSCEHILNFKLELLASDLFRATIVCNGEVDTQLLADKVHSLLETSRPPTIKKTPFIAPLSSGKYISFKTMDRILSYA